MTECKQFQKRFSATPSEKDRLFFEHVEHCTECAEFVRQIRVLHKRLRSVMEVRVPASLQFNLKKIPTRESRRLWRNRGSAVFALAASVILGVGLFHSGVIRLPVKPSLEQVVYEHIIHEPEALSAVFPVKQALVTSTFQDFGVEFSDSELGEILHVRLCPIGNTHGLHLVVQGQRGPVTLLFMPTESVQTRTSFQHGKFAGIIEPAEVGLVAIVGEQGEILEPYANAVKQSMNWL